MLFKYSNFNKWTFRFYHSHIVPYFLFISTITNGSDRGNRSGLFWIPALSVA